MKNNNSKNIFKVFGAWLKERVRKFFVALKKNPQAFPLVALLISFMYYSLNLTFISNTTAKLQGSNMGLAAFITMLFMMLSFVCMLNAFPKRKKPNVLMIVIMIVLYGVIIFADVHYLDRISYALTTSDSTLNQEALTYIYKAWSIVSTHIYLIGATVVLVVLEPLIANLVKKIKTSIEIEGGENIDSIDISGED
ncbi:MAG: hypothetical protein IJW93_01950 [Clostridia bacterium]|nr:hypothetical protein [Clostridia bacterium]